MTIQIIADVINGLVYEQAKALAVEEIELAARLRKDALKDQHANELLESILEDVMTLELQAVADSVARKALEMR